MEITDAGNVSIGGEGYSIKKSERVSLKQFFSFYL